MKILIYGGGAVGLGIASCLLKAGIDIDIIARPVTVNAIKKYGLKRTGIFGDYAAEKSSFKCFEELSESRNRNYTHILVCTNSI